MPEINRFFGIVIKMYFNDHTPPHFHEEYGEHIAELNIDTLDILHGYLPQRVLGLVLEWAVLHRAELRSNWAQARSRDTLTPIAPLE